MLPGILSRGRALEALRPVPHALVGADLNRITGDWYSLRPALKHQTHITKGTEVPSEPGLPSFVC